MFLSRAFGFRPVQTNQRKTSCKLLLTNQLPPFSWGGLTYNNLASNPVIPPAIVRTDSTPDGNKHFAGACNTLHLIVSKGVLDALHDFQDEIRVSNANRDDERHDALLSRLEWEIGKTCVFRTIRLSTDLGRGCGVPGSAVMTTPVDRADVHSPRRLCQGGRLVLGLQP